MSVGDNPAQVGGYNVFQHCKKLLYWQGFWLDDPEPDLDFYLQFCSPWLAHLLVKHRYLRLVLRLVRKILPWFLIITSSAHVFFLFPMSIYLYMSDEVNVMANCFAIVLVGLQLAAIFCVYFQLSTLRDLLVDIEHNMLVPEQLDNREQNIIFNGARRFCGNILKRGIPLVVTFIVLPTLWDYFFVLLPQRRFVIREWFPWDTTSSPNFEITLFMRLLETSLITLVSTTQIGALSSGMFLPTSCFKILNNKLEHIRPISINRIKERKLKASDLSSDHTIVTIDREDSQHVQPGRALQGHEIRAGRAALNARRVDNLSLVRPLYETPVIVRNEMPFQSVIQGHQFRHGQATLNPRRVEMLEPLYEAYNPIPGAVGDELPLTGAIQGHQIRTRPPAVNAGRVDNLSLLRPLYEAYNPIPGAVRDELPLAGAIQGHQIRTRPPAVNARRVDNLSLLRPLYEAYNPIPGAVRDELPLAGAIQGHQIRTRPPAVNARRVDNLSLLRPLYEAYNPIPGAVRDELPLAGAIQEHQIRTRPPAVNARRVDNLPLLRPLYEADYNVPETGMCALYAKRANYLRGITDEELNKEMEIVLAENVNLHMRLIRYFATCASYLNALMIVMLGVNKLVLGVTAILFLKRGIDDVNAFFSVIFSLMVTSVYLLMNNVMQTISDQHDAVCKSIYNSDWLEASPSFKKSMLVIMSRANVPLEMKPTGLDPLSRKNFSQVMYSAYNMISTMDTVFK